MVKMYFLLASEWGGGGGWLICLISNKLIRINYSS